MNSSFTQTLKFPHFLFKTLFICICLLINFQTNAQTAVERYGQLKVSKNRIVDQHNNPVTLRGMSLYWSQWKPEFYNKEVVKRLKEDWCINVIRAAMAVDAGHTNYLTNPTAEMNKVTTIVDAAIELGIYVIIDFHSHHANDHIEAAKKFFHDVSLRYKDHPNVLYEIWNEPLDVSWTGVVKPYSETIISTIRKNDPDNIIICGTPKWCQDVDVAADSPIITSSNIAYSLHYYAATHKDGFRTKATNALNKGIALFVTEYGTCTADGNGFVDEAESKKWWEYLENNYIGYCNWSVSNVNEAASIVKPFVNPKGDWTVDSLTTSGLLVRNQLLDKCDGTNVFNLSTEDKKSSFSGQYFPNPFNESIKIEMEEFFEYSIYDSLGNIVEEGSAQGKAELGKDLYPGIYFIRIKSKGTEDVLKIHKI